MYVYIYIYIHMIYIFINGYIQMVNWFAWVLMVFQSKTLQTDHHSSRIPSAEASMGAALQWPRALLLFEGLSIWKASELFFRPQNGKLGGIPRIPHFQTRMILYSQSDVYLWKMTWNHQSKY